MSGSSASRASSASGSTTSPLRLKKTVRGGEEELSRGRGGLDLPREFSGGRRQLVGLTAHEIRIRRDRDLEAAAAVVRGDSRRQPRARSRPQEMGVVDEESAPRTEGRAVGLGAARAKGRRRPEIEIEGADEHGASRTPAPLEFPHDGVEKMGLAGGGRAPDDEGIVQNSRRGGRLASRGESQAVGGAHAKGVEGLARVVAPGSRPSRNVRPGGSGPRAFSRRREEALQGLEERLARAFVKLMEIELVIEALRA